jgi:riboflavin synthase
MFTGIVEAVGRIATAVPRADGLRLIVHPGALGLDDVRVGDSIAVAGCCLTLVEKDSGGLSFDVSAETLACTTGLDRARSVNLEKALRLSDRLGGHLVSGHVDGVGVVAAVDAVGDPGGSTRLSVDAPRELARFIATKGSVAVEGVSLTVNAVDGCRFAVNLIPHTLAVTTLRELAPGERVNLEVDQVARYVARLQETP